MYEARLKETKRTKFQIVFCITSKPQPQTPSPAIDMTSSEKEGDFAKVRRFEHPRQQELKNLRKLETPKKVTPKIQ